MRAPQYGGQFSLKAAAVAGEVIRRMNKGQPVVFADIQQKMGYNRRSVVVKKVLNTQTFQHIMRPFLEQLREKHDAILQYLTPDKLKRASAKDILYCADIMTKNRQLLENKPTEIAETTTTFNTTEDARAYIEKALEQHKKTA